MTSLQQKNRFNLRKWEYILLPQATGNFTSHEFPLSARDSRKIGEAWKIHKSDPRKNIYISAHLVH